MRRPRSRLLFGLCLAIFGLVLVFLPLAVADLLGRPSATPPERINLRASWGGSVLGFGAFVAWLPAVRPLKRLLLGLVVWSLAGIGLARGAGFLLDGGPDALQWLWLVAEAVLSAICAFLLLRKKPDKVVAS